MNSLKIRKWNSAEHLKTEDDIALYFEVCLQEAGDDLDDTQTPFVK